MKKILLIILLSNFSIACSQTKNSDYSNEVNHLKAFVEDTYKSDSTKVKAYAKNENNGKIFPIKTDDLYSEFDFEVFHVYEFLRKNDKVVFARKTPISESGDWAMSFSYYFNNDGRLIGAEKSVSSFYGEQNKLVTYTARYELSNKTEKLERVDVYYTDHKDNKIQKKSKLYKEAVEGSMITEFVGNMDQITFQDLESFMITEKIKYYKTD